MITIARESRGFNQKEFAELINMSNSNIGKMENGDIGVTRQNLAIIAAETDYPLHFFLQEGEVLNENLAWKKRRKVAKGLIVPIFAKANIITRQVQILNKALHLSSPTIPKYIVSQTENASLIAGKVKAEWGIEEVQSTLILKMMEDHGIIVNTFDFNTSRVDSLSMLTNDRRPVIFLNDKLEGDKQRFTLAYELGQLVMHTYNPTSNSDIGREANQFAAEFLMPENEIRKDFDQGVSFTRLAELKSKWKVSMIALLYRADDLGYLTSNQKRYLMQQFNEAKIRRHEPEDLKVAAEQPRLMKFLIGELRAKSKMSVTDTAALLCLQIGEFIEMYS